MLVVVPLNSILFNHMKAAENLGLNAYHIDQAGNISHLENDKSVSTDIGKILWTVFLSPPVLLHGGLLCITFCLSGVCL